MASSQDAPLSKRAMSQLYEAYQKPLLSFARYWGLAEEDARDAIQNFFLTLIDQHQLEAADAAKGRLRNYFLILFRRQLSQEYRARTALKRGGGVTHQSIDEAKKVSSRHSVLSTEETAESCFNREWARSLVNTAVEKVALSWTPKRGEQLFVELRPHLLEEPDRKPLNEIASSFGLAEGTLRSQLHRLRLSFHHELWNEVSNTLEDQSPEAVRAELMELCRFFN